MSLEEKKLTVKTLMWCVGTLAVIWAAAYGYVWVRLGVVEAKTESASAESVDIKTQLSQIQTDLQWIKLNLSK